MKKYYILFCYSETVGGGQNYQNSKVKWLNENGWCPIIFTASRNYSFFKCKNNKIPWVELNKYSRLKSIYLSMPPEHWPKRKVEKELNRMVAVIPKSAEPIIIESHTDYWSEWGELLAQRLDAKNFCYLLDELLEQSVTKEFLYFKFLRREVAGIDRSSMHRLFAGYQDVPVGNDYVLTAANYGSVVDFDSDIVSDVKRCDYNIAYMGRHKQYMENILDGVIKFCYNSANKTVNFIILGELNDSLLRKYEQPKNLIVTKLGFITPIPKIFFSKIDVLIAGAGCALLSAREGIPVIVADAGTMLANGILGYTTRSILFSEANKKTFDEALKDVLVDKIHEQMEFSLPEDRDAGEAYKEHFMFIEKSEKKLEYFNFIEKPQRKYRPLYGYMLIIRFNIINILKKIWNYFKKK